MLPSQHPYATCCPTFIVAEDLGRPDCHGTGAMTDRKWYTKLLLLHSKAPNLCEFVPTKVAKRWLMKTNYSIYKRSNIVRPPCPWRAMHLGGLENRRLVFSLRCWWRSLMILNPQCIIRMSLGSSVLFMYYSPIWIRLTNIIHQVLSHLATPFSPCLDRLGAGYWPGLGRWSTESGTVIPQQFHSINYCKGPGIKQG